MGGHREAVEHATGVEAPPSSTHNRSPPTLRTQHGGDHEG
jgi:hypothetical protein